MNTPNTPMANDPELDALLGAYALDALDPDERARIEEYVARNPRARDELDELRESAAALALAPVDDVSAPPGLWNRISDAIAADVTPAADAPPISLAEHRVRKQGWGARAGWLVAAAAAIVMVVLAVQTVSLNGRLDDARDPSASGVAAAFERAQDIPGAREVALKPGDGAEVARVVLLPDGTGYLKNDAMQPLDAGETYQLWAMAGDPDKPTVISAGVLGADPKAAAFKTAGDIHGFAITVEKTPGVVSSTQPAYASASV